MVSVLHSPKHIGKKPPGFWDNILWSDESKFNLFGSDGKVMVWRMPKEEFDPKCAVPTVKHTGGNVKCWGCFSTAGVGTLVFIDGNMTGNMYRDILEKNLFESVKILNLDNKCIFQHGNDPKHRAYVVAHWLDQNGVERLKWPSFSPYVNIIEHMWVELERRMKNNRPKTEKGLKEALLRVWHSIGKDVTKKLVDLIPNRLNEVILMKDYPTRY